MGKLQKYVWHSFNHLTILYDTQNILSFSIYHAENRSEAKIWGGRGQKILWNIYIMKAYQLQLRSRLRILMISMWRYEVVLDHFSESLSRNYLIHLEEVSQIVAKYHRTKSREVAFHKQNSSVWRIYNQKK